MGDLQTWSGGQGMIWEEDESQLKDVLELAWWKIVGNVSERWNSMWEDLEGREPAAF